MPNDEKIGSHVRRVSRVIGLTIKELQQIPFI